MRRIAVVAAFLALGAAAAVPVHAAALGPRAIRALDAHAYALVALRGGSGEFAVRAAGGTLVSPALRIWRLPGKTAARLGPQLVAAGAADVVEPDYTVHRFGNIDQGDPLIPQEWWIPAVGADQVQPPGPGVPLTMIDSGLDMTHPEFANRPDTTLLNQQTINTPDDAHGTATSSVAAAPANGIGLVGVYPQAVLRFWDASPGADIPDSVVIAGIDTASRIGRGVINLSLGSDQPDPLLARVIVLAFGRGSIVVASSGNSFDQGNPRTYPASYPHVLTVAATKQDNTPAEFSSSSAAVDLSAPGVDIPVAVPYFLTTRPATTAPTARASPRRSSPARRPGSGRSGPRSRRRRSTT